MRLVKFHACRNLFSRDPRPVRAACTLLGASWRGDKRGVHHAPHPFSEIIGFVCPIDTGRGALSHLPEIRDFLPISETAIRKLRHVVEAAPGSFREHAHGMEGRETARRSNQVSIDANQI